MKTWEQIKKDLSGQNGFFYIMYVGRETTGKEVADELKNKEIVADPEDQVYAAISFLERNGYLNTVGREGRKKFRTGNLGPIVESFEKCEMLFNQDVIGRIGKYMKYFPDFASMVFRESSYDIHGLEWEVIFQNLYLSYFKGIVGLSFIKQLSSKQTQGNIDPFRFIFAAIKLHQEATKRYRERVSRVSGLYKKISEEDQVIFARYCLEQLKPPLEKFLNNIGGSHEKEKVFHKLHSLIGVRDQTSMNMDS